MSVWVVAPSAAPVGQAKLCFQSWREQGYQVAVAAEDTKVLHQLEVDLLVLQEVHPGYAKAINRLARKVLEHDPECTVVVAAADDYFPDQKKRAAEIEALFIDHFDGTLGVMQPTGDRWSSNPDGVPNIDKAAMSPWLGRAWCLRSYEGAGPLWPGYFHNWVDNDLQEVAKGLGLFWANPDITQIHQHWLRLGNAPPPHAQQGSAHWDQDKELFQMRHAAGFPESKLLPEEEAA